MNRNREIIKTSIIGVAANLLLAGFKVTIGLLANSVSVLSDAINNAADALSSILTIVGTKLSEKEPDRNHPFGYGRVEYLFSLAIGIIIAFAGIDSLENSVERILHPEPIDFDTSSIIIMSIAVVIKLAVGLYTKKRGELLESESLVASGKEGLSDVLATIATIVAAFIYVRSSVNIEAYVGLVISILIIKTGVETILDTSSVILGKSSDLELVNKIKDSISSFSEVEGVYDIIIHSYGKNKQIASAHVEVSDKYTVAWVDNLERHVARKVKEDTGVELSGLSIYAINTESPEVIKTRDAIRKIVDETEGANNMHGFYIDMIDKSMNFDVVLAFGSRSKDSLLGELQDKVHKLYPDYSIGITVDYDFAE